MDPAPFYPFANTLQFTYEYRNSVWRIQIRIILLDPDPNYCFGSGSETYFAGTGIVKNRKTKIQRVVKNLKNLMIL